MGAAHETIGTGPAGKKTGTILVFSQVYVPDPTSVGQHMADVAEEMVRRGNRVLVLTADTDYNDPKIRFPRRETVSGVEVRRLPYSSLGKGSFAIRMLGALLFIIQATIVGLFTPGVSGVLVSTSPPLCAMAAVILRVLRGIPFLYWVMDLNPDQLIALRTIGERSLPARLLGEINAIALRKASRVVALDRFMAERLQRRTDLKDKISIVAPWPHEQHLAAVDHDENTFRARHGLQGKLVVMYSGNHSASNPLETLLE
ncbi:MAG: glycosyltransferase family 4 protein, partial [Chloroflexi bacterium]|nr:glycosyltransferase family 4 protein [Chloroflexota bacterium]